MNSYFLIKITNAAEKIIPLLPHDYSEYLGNLKIGLDDIFQVSLLIIP